MVCRFTICYIFQLLGVNPRVFSSQGLRVFLTLFPCCLSIRFFCYVLFIAIFYTKIALFPGHPVVGMSSCIHPLLVGRIFFCCFGMSCFVSIFFILSPFFRQYLLIYFLELYYFFYLCYFFLFVPTCSNLFSSVLTFLLVVVDLLCVFPVEFPIKILSFCSRSLGEYRLSHRLISLLHRISSR